jgi:hypothetical protein
MRYRKATSRASFRFTALFLMLGGAGVLAGAASAAPNAHFECAKRPTTTSEGAPNAAMLQTLGVLRGAATIRDVLPSESSPSFGLGEGLYVKYVRLARTVAGTACYLIPIAKGCGSLGEEVVLETRGPGEFGGSGGETLAEIKQGQSVSTWVRNKSSTAWGVVPDKVATVVLTYPLRPTGRKRHRSVRVSAAVVNNVFVANLSFLSTHAPALGVAPTTIAWRSTKGKVIRTIHPKS